MIIEDGLLRTEGDGANRTAFGSVKFTPEDENDLYQLYRIITKGDLLAVDNASYRKKVDVDVYVVDTEFDRYRLSVDGEVAAGRKSRVSAGTRRGITIEKNTTFNLTKSKWDYFDLEFLDYARVTVPVCPVVVVLLHPGLGEIYLIGDGWTRSVTSSPNVDELKLFERMSISLVSEINLHHVDHIFVASDGAIQNNFKRYIDGSSNVKLKGDLLKHKSKICTLQVPVAVGNPSGENLKHVLLHPHVIRETRGKVIKALAEVQSLKHFREEVNEQPNSTSLNEAQIMLLKEGISTLLLSDELFRNGSRSKYLGLLVLLKEKNVPVIFFSKFNLWHADLGPTKVAAIFEDDAPRPEDE